MLGIWLRFTFSGVPASSLTVEDSMSVAMKDSSMLLADSEETLGGSKVEVYPDGVSRSARLLKLGSPRTEKDKVRLLNHVVRQIICHLSFMITTLTLKQFSLMLVLFVICQVLHHITFIFTTCTFKLFSQ